MDAVDGLTGVPKCIAQGGVGLAVDPRETNLLVFIRPHCYLQQWVRATPATEQTQLTLEMVNMSSKASLTASSVLLAAKGTDKFSRKPNTTSSLRLIGSEAQIMDWISFTPCVRGSSPV